MIFLCVLIFKLSLQGELCPWLPTCRWGRHILSGVAHCVVESLGHCFVFLQEKAVALPPRTGGGLISSGTIRFASTTLDGTRDYWLLGFFRESFKMSWESFEKLRNFQSREKAGGDEGGLKDREPTHPISELSIGSIIVLALLGLSLIACGILCTLKRCGPPAQVRLITLWWYSYKTERNGINYIWQQDSAASLSVHLSNVKRHQ